MCLHSLSNNGLKQKLYDRYRLEIIQVGLSNVYVFILVYIASILCVIFFLSEVWHTPSDISSLPGEGRSP